MIRRMSQKPQSMASRGDDPRNPPRCTAKQWGRWSCLLRMMNPGLDEACLRASEEKRSMCSRSCCVQWQAAEMGRMEQKNIFKIQKVTHIIIWSPCEKPKSQCLYMPVGCVAKQRGFKTESPKRAKSQSQESSQEDERVEEPEDSKCWRVKL